MYILSNRFLLKWQKLNQFSLTEIIGEIFLHTFILVWENLHLLLISSQTRPFLLCFSLDTWCVIVSTAKCWRIMRRGKSRIDSINIGQKEFLSEASRIYLIGIFCTETWMCVKGRIANVLYRSDKIVMLPYLNFHT